MTDKPVTPPTAADLYEQACAEHLAWCQSLLGGTAAAHPLFSAWQTWWGQAWQQATQTPKKPE